MSDKEVSFPTACNSKFSDLLHITKKCLAKKVENRFSASELYALTYKNSPELCKMIIPDTYVNNSNLKNIHNQYMLANTKLGKPAGKPAAAAAAAAAAAPVAAAHAGQKRCFIRGCNAVLPPNHKYNRCDKCFNTRCLDCYKQHTPGHKFRRCNDCYAKYRNRN